MSTLTFSSLLRRPCQKVNDLLLRWIGFACSRDHQVAKGLVKAAVTAATASTADAASDDAAGHAAKGVGKHRVYGEHRIGGKHRA